MSVLRPPYRSSLTKAVDVEGFALYTMNHTYCSVSFRVFPCDYALFDHHRDAAYNHAV